MVCTSGIGDVCTAPPPIEMSQSVALRAGNTVLSYAIAVADK